MLEVIEEADRLALERPEGMALTWIVNPHSEVPGTELEDTFKAIPWRDGRASAWMAGEFVTAIAVVSLGSFFALGKPSWLPIIGGDKKESVLVFLVGSCQGFETVKK